MKQTINLPFDMKNKCIVLVTLWFSLFSLAGHSQINQGGSPYSFQNPQLVKSAVPVNQMQKIELNRLMAEDSINDSFKDIPWRFGENIYVNFNLQNSGTWDILPKGDKLWRLGIRCRGAYTINLTFDNYHLPPGATLFVYNADKSQVIGAFTDFNNQTDKVFATTLVSGEEITIEYYEPSNPAFPGELNLYRVTHGYRDAYGYAKSLGSSGSCNNNVVCPESAGWENQIKSVCMLVSGGSGFCSGAIVNNTSQNGVPYVLTANHCYSDPSSWVFWFNWQSPTCTNPTTSPAYNSISGATLKARNASSDFCLVQMNTTPPAAYGVYYAGWNRQNVGATSGAGIHHPSGDIKKISFSVTTFTSNTWSGTPADSHWNVSWSDGVTEPGSSGSPMFDQNHRIIGQLHGGPSACGGSDLSDLYGKVSMSWDYGTTSSTELKDWLDPTNISGNTLDGWDPNGFVPIVTTTAATSVTFTEATLNGTVNPNTLATMYHFDWGTLPSYGNSTTSTSAGSGTTAVPVTASLTGLTTGTTYHFRLVGVNSQGTTNGNDLTFTPGGATVTTTAASSITMSSATAGGNVSSDGGLSVTARGVCWSTSASPDISGSHTVDGFGTGVFVSSLAGLAANTTYHIRAYATSSGGTFYGNDLTFTTLCGTITLFPWNEGFENAGVIPNCWSQEQVSSSGIYFTFITGNGSGNPATAHGGTFNACLKDASSGDNKTKLITPPINLSSIGSPQLTFWHTQAFWSPDQDQLIIYYKTSSTGTWTQLTSYTASITAWTMETVSLPSASSDYYIAFEGNAKYGYGVCIDDVSITGTGGPNLSVAPANQSVTAAVGTTSFTVTSNSAWIASSNQTWCTVTASGTGNGTITANYVQNTSAVSRVANITVTVATLTPIIVTVTQAAPSLSVTPANQSVAATAVTTNFTVTSNSAWTASGDQSWCTATPSGTGNGSITANFSANLAFVQRIANITVTVAGMTPVVVTVTQAATPSPEFNFTIANDVQTSDKTLEFDLYLLDFQPSTPFELSIIQAGILVNNGIIGSGTITTSIVPGYSDLVASQQPAIALWSTGTTNGCIKITPNSGPSCGNGTIIGTSGLGTRICRIRIANSVPFTSNSQANLAFNFPLSPYPTKVFQYYGTPCVGNLLATNSTNCFSLASNPVLNGPPSLSVSPSDQPVTAALGMIPFVVTSNANWTATSNQSWCTVTPSGFGNGAIAATYTANPNPTPRVASITVTVAGLTPVVVTVTQADAANRTVNLSLFLEGLYDGYSVMRPAMDEFAPHWGQTIADKLTVELHNGANYSSIVYTASNVVLNTNGTISFTIPSTYSGNYYVTIVHRNSILTTSATPVAFSSPVITYDFDFPGKVYGNNIAMMLDGRYVFYSGDVNQDGLVDGSDLSDIDNLSNSASSGYLPEDVNGDGLVDGSDLSITGNNADVAIGAITP